MIFGVRVSVLSLRWLALLVLALSVALLACSSGSGNGGAAGSGGSGGATGSGGGGGIGAGGHGGNAGTAGSTGGAEVASTAGASGSGDGTAGGATGSGGASATSCGELLSCCVTSNSSLKEEGCLFAAGSLQTGPCAGYLPQFEPNGVCAVDASGPAPQACGPQCTLLAGCCNKLDSEVEISISDESPSVLVSGCMALSTQCTTGSEALCKRFIMIAETYVTNFTCP